ncbi:MAG: S-methyl-5-thioribose-1-phosphate isomerase [Gemmatimonadota bacterium]
MSSPTDRVRPPTTVRWADDGCGIVILDQTRLPEERIELELRDLESIAEAIRSLRVRGAPLIGVAAAMGVAALATAGAEQGMAVRELAAAVAGWCDRLAATRPTGRNLRWALDRVYRRTASAPAGGASKAGGTVPQPEGAAELAERLRAEATDILEEDRAMCRRIGEHALSLFADGATALTHCNAGALATAGIGTALAPIYVAREQGRRVRVFVDETRPLLQGSRLTAWELEQAGVDVTLIADSTAAALMGRGEVDLVIVGADRIAANGDVANKVGTYGLAVLARHHGIPFYVAAPRSTVDLGTPSGAEVPIEERSPDEVRRGFGRLTAPADVRVWTPAFDVTPAELIAGIITDRGIARPPYAESLRAIFDDDPAVAVATT